MTLQKVFDLNADREASRERKSFCRPPLQKRSCKRELDGADGFAFEEFGVGSDTEGFQQAGLHFP